MHRCDVKELFAVRLILICSYQFFRPICQHPDTQTTRTHTERVCETTYTHIHTHMNIFHSTIEFTHTYTHIRTHTHIYTYTRRTCFQYCKFRTFITRKALHRNCWMKLHRSSTKVCVCVSVCVYLIYICMCVCVCDYVCVCVVYILSYVTCMCALIKRMHTDTPITHHTHMLHTSTTQTSSHTHHTHVPHTSHTNAHTHTADAFVLVSAEYNHSIPPGLSNMLDHFGGSVYAFKPSGLVTYSPVHTNTHAHTHITSHIHI